MNLKPEPTAKAWIFRALLGPAQIIDGIVNTLTICTFGPGLGLKCARSLAVARCEATRRVIHPTKV